MFFGTSGCWQNVTYHIIQKKEQEGEGEQEENNMLNVQLEKKCNNLTWIKNLDWKEL